MLNNYGKISAGKLSLRSPWLILSLAAASGFLLIAFWLTPGLSERESAAPPPAAPAESPARLALAAKVPESAGIPLRLQIPKIKVDAAVEQVGLTPRGEVGVPKGPANAAWFKLGPRPGEVGSAIIDGHYGIWKNGRATVFNNLHKLRPGDKIYVKDDKGATLTFVVRELKTYDLRDDATAVFVASDNKAHLNLITCEGIWSKAKRSYSDRLVVFTDRE